MLEDRPEYEFEKRTPSEYSNELHLYKARLYKHIRYGDDRFQVRILPYMVDIPEDELDNLPKYPAFFKGEFPNGKSEVQDGKEQASLLWVLATPDFTVGYVLGPASYFSSCADTTMKDSWNYSEVKQAVQRSGAITENFDYKDIVVQVRNAGGTYLEFYSVSSGYKYMMTAYGDLISVQDHKIILQAREGVDSGAAQSTVVIEPNRVGITTQTFEVTAKDVILGHRNLYPLGTILDQSVSCDGMNLSPATNIHL